MKLTGLLVKQISIQKDRLFETILGSIYDEYDKKYSDVYSFEMSGFIRDIEHDLSILESNHLTINEEILKSQIIVKWFCGFDNCNMNEFNIYVEKLLETARRDTMFEGSFKIEEDEKEFVKMLLNKEIEVNRKAMANLILNEKDDTTKLLMYFREGDLPHYENIIAGIKNDYVKSINLMYKLFGNQPKDWSTGLSLHESVCRSFNIDRESFLF